MKTLFLISLLTIVSCATATTVVPKDEPSQLQCTPSGCSGQICAEKGKSVISTCLMLPQYECVKKSRCEVQSNGKCGWTPTDEYLACLKRYQPAQNR